MLVLVVFSVMEQGSMSVIIAFDQIPKQKFIIPISRRCEATQWLASMYLRCNLVRFEEVFISLQACNVIMVILRQRAIQKSHRNSFFNEGSGMKSRCSPVSQNDFRGVQKHVFGFS